MTRLAAILAQLRKYHGAPKLPPAKGPFELILWENACYLLPDERRTAVFEGLKNLVGLDPKGIRDAPHDVLLTLAKAGGMRPETRVFRWREIARITLDQFGGDLNRILKGSVKEAKKALKQFPNIGDPGAEKILLYCGQGPDLPLDWNGVRVLTRLGYGRSQKNYGAAYRSVQEAIRPELPRGAAALARAYLLLREHGKTLCRNNRPRCPECPLERSCAYAGSQRL